MPYRRDAFIQGGFYHVYNRTLPGAPLVFVTQNYAYFLRLVQRYRQTYGVGVIAYCLMPNHFHFLLHQETDKPLSRFVAALLNAYVQAVNRQQARHGPLFEGRFRHVCIEDETYLTHLCRYIHLNPVKAGLAKVPEGWPYSNYCDWVGLRAGSLKDDAFICEHFGAPGAYRSFVEEYQEGEEAILVKYLWD